MNISDNNSSLYSLTIDDYLIPSISVGFSIWIIVSNGLLLKLCKDQKYFLQRFFFCTEIIFGFGAMVENADHLRRLLIDNWYTSSYCTAITLGSFFGDLFSHWMICTMSLERLAAIAIPYRYRNWNRKTLSVTFVGITFLLSFVNSGATFYGEENTVKPVVCIAASYRPVFSYMKFVAGFLAVFLNILIVICLRIRMKQKAASTVFDDINEENLFKSEVKACRVVTMVVINYFIFSVVPVGLLIMSPPTIDSTFSKIAAYGSLLILFCSSINIFLYLWKDEKIRRDFIDLMKKNSVAHGIAPLQSST